MFLLSMLTVHSLSNIHTHDLLSIRRFISTDERHQIYCEQRAAAARNKRAALIAEGRLEEAVPRVIRAAVTANEDTWKLERPTDGYVARKRSDDMPDW